MNKDEEDADVLESLDVEEGKKAVPLKLEEELKLNWGGGLPLCDTPSPPRLMSSRSLIKENSYREPSL